jgi:hypothetical protein
VDRSARIPPARRGFQNLDGLDGGAALEPLREEDRPDAAGLALHRAQLLELLERHGSRLVDQQVLAVPHRLDRQLRAAVRHGGAGHQGNRGVFQDRARVGGAAGLREALLEQGREVVPRAVPCCELGARSQQRRHLSQRVDVIETERGEADGGRIGGHG